MKAITIRTIFKSLECRSTCNFKKIIWTAACRVQGYAIGWSLKLRWIYLVQETKFEIWVSYRHFTSRIDWTIDFYTRFHKLILRHRFCGAGLVDKIELHFPVHQFKERMFEKQLQRNFSYTTISLSPIQSIYFSHPERASAVENLPVFQL